MHTTSLLVTWGTAEQPLPTTNVDFHFLPQSELRKNEKKVLRSVANAGHSLVRALTLQMRVLEEEVELVSPSHRRVRVQRAL